MEFCPNATFVPHWFNHEINQCFAETVTSSTLLSTVLLFGLVQAAVFYKYSTTNHLHSSIRSCLFLFHIVLHVLIPLVAIASLLTQAFYIQNGHFFGYQILSTGFTVLTWTLSLALVMMERKRQLPVMPTRGHGVVLLLLWVLAFAAKNLPFISFYGPDYWWKLESGEDRVRFGQWLADYILTFLVLFVGLRAPAKDMEAYTRMENGQISSEQSPVGSTWKGIKRKVMLIAPMVWPRGSLLLQGYVIFCAGLLVAGRICNLYVPIYYKYIVDEVPTRFCWDNILIWMALRFLQGGGGGGSMGFLPNLRSLVWIKVQQYTSRKTQVDLFHHLHNLSLRYHLSRKTGEVLKVMDRGVDSISNILNYVVFNIMPTMVDIVIAIIYFIIQFDIYFGLIVLGTMILYIVGTIYVTEWRTKYRRTMNQLENAFSAKAVDSLLNFETVKYYGNVKYEVESYDGAIKEFQGVEWKTNASLNLLNFVQNVTITAGLIGGALLCAWYIHHGDTIGHRKLTVGDFVLFVTYVLQLYGPLNFFGSYYQSIQSSFINMENMFKLLAEQQEVQDVAGAPAIHVKHGEIEFDNVHFHYEPRKPILRGISFKVPAGETYALVGASGAGKSSIVRLLFRFYDIQQGSIKIDGVDISKVQQESLRQCIGIVPQDTVLFNNDIRFNIRYGRTSATDHDVEAAAEAADMHNRILTFPDGYSTVVGERGLKLSGGEKQRVAIARTILKNPAVILLDEATSALDTQTERNILTSFEKICERRTTLVVAHRLSTIIHAHRILVIDDGALIEDGTHEELLEARGKYWDMWSQQQKKKEASSDQPGSDPEDGSS